VTSQVIRSLVEASVRATTSTTSSPDVGTAPGAAVTSSPSTVDAAAEGCRTTAAAASLNRACATICCRSAGVGDAVRDVGLGGCTCRLVSSRQSRTAGRRRATTKSLTAPSPGSAA